MTDFVIDIDFGAPVTISGILLKKVSQGEQWLTIYHYNFSIKVGGPEIMYTLPVDHKVEMKVTYVDAKGNPAAVDGPVTWTTSDGAKLNTLVDTVDSTLCSVVPVGPIGQVQVTASADVDLGTGVKALLTTCDIDLVAGEAVSGTIAPVGAPVPIA